MSRLEWALYVATWLASCLVWRDVRLKGVLQ